MVDCIVMVSRNRVRRGKSGDFAKHYLGSIPRVDEDKPGTLFQAAYLNEEGTEAVILRVFKDGRAMDEHLDGADQRSLSAYQHIKPTAVEIYGSPSIKAMALIRKVVGDQVLISEYPESIGGVLRLESN